MVNWFAKVFVLFLAFLPYASAQFVAVLSPGVRVQSLVDGFPAGTIFVFLPGTYRQQTIVPKHRNQFYGLPGAVLSGARLLSPTREGQYWVASGPRAPLPFIAKGTCNSEFPDCRLRDDLYLNNVPLTRVSRLNQLTPGKWFPDYSRGLIYIADDPTGKTLEIAETEAAFTGGAQGVMIFGLTIEKYASPAQQGAIYASMSAGASGWRVEGNEIRLNHGVGLTLHPAMTARDNRIHTNGQLGAGGAGESILFEDNEVYGNNYAHYYEGWEAGGAKFAVTRGIVVRGNKVHHNAGPGLWTDIDAVDSLYENNIVEYNDREGIVHEISYAAVIRDNIVRFNGSKRFIWLWGSQILIQNSQSVTVTGNTVQVAGSGGNGISLIHQSRGSGRYGPYLTRNNNVHHNTIVYDGDIGMSGKVTDFSLKELLEGNNRFDGNIYRFRSNQDRWFWPEETDWLGLRAYGQERNGRIE